MQRHTAAHRWTVSGKLGLGMPFDGSDHYVDCDNFPIWNQTSGIRIEAWVRPDADPTPADTADDNRDIISKTNGAGNGYFLGMQYFDFDTDGNTDSVVFEGGTAYQGGGLFLQSTQSFPWGTWHSRRLRVRRFRGPPLRRWSACRVVRQ